MRAADVQPAAERARELLAEHEDAREVAEACAANDLAIVVPCHRVVKKGGRISGYRWGVRRKRALIEREHQALWQLN